MAAWAGSFRALIVLAAVLAGAPALADWQEYHARYSVYRNGKLIGKAEFAFERGDGGQHWQIRSEAAGTHGMARLLRARDTEMTQGTIRDGRFWPEAFTHQTTVAGIESRWTAEFDWESGIVAITEGREQRTLELVDGALDGLSLKVELQRRLRDGEDDLQFHLVDDDEIKQQRFRMLAPERLETSLGCLQTVPVERIRGSSTRYTRAWHAPELDYVTVRMEHGKTGGDHMELRISELVVDGLSVDPQAGCIAHRGGP